MTAVELLSLLADKDVRLSVIDGQLKVSAPKGVLTAELQQLLIANKPEVIALLSTTAMTGQSRQIKPADRRQALPLSFAQQRLWFLNEFEPGSSLYNIPSALRVRGALNTTALQQAFDALIARHESLRTTFVSEAQETVQKIAPQLSVALQHIAAGGISDVDLNARLTGLCLQPFDLQTGPLLRLYVIKISPTEHAVLLVIHHIIADGWSMGLLMTELAEFYNSTVGHRDPQLAALPIQSADYAVWQQNTMQGEHLARELNYWQQQLAGAPLVLDLPTDHPRPAAPGYAGAWLRHEIPLTTRQRLEAIAQQHNATLYMVLLSAFNVLLARYSGSNDLLVGSPVAGRNRSELEGVIGALINTVVLRSDLSDNPSFTELLTRTRNVTLDAFEHQELPFEKLVEQLQPDRNLSHSPLYQVLFNLQNRSQEVVSFSGLESSALITETGTAKLDLHLLMEETESGLTAWFEYATELFDAETIERMAEHLDTVLNAIIEDPARPINDISLLTSAERRRILGEWNNTAVDYPQHATLISLFHEQVDKTPDAIALEFEAQQLSYRQLDQRANQLAHELLAAGAAKDAVIGVYMERSIEMVVALYGIQKAGAAYTPLDPEYPAQRLSHMLEDCGAQIVLCQTGRKPEGFTGMVVELNSDGLSDRRAENPQSDSRPAQQPTAESLAYVIFTSGSTGRPKGVMNEHRGIVNRLLWMQDEYPLSAADRVLQKTAFSFDVSVWEFFWPLLTGARLVMAKPGGHKDPLYLAELIQNTGITTLHFVPSMLQAFLLSTGAGACTGLRQVFCSGEALPWDLTQDFYSKSDAALHNLYGPTEAAVDVTYWPVPKHNLLRRVPIGKPVANTQIYIVDNAGQLAPAGIPGELLIAGRQVARGYIARDELTAERFIQDPYNDTPGARAYRSGDLARFLKDGTIEYLGRIDGQIKLRGFRIELGEIDAALNAIDGVSFCTTLIRNTATGDPRLVSYVGSSTAHDETNSERLRTALARTLPDYMVPAAIVFIDELPLTPNGKLDRNALPEPVFATAEYVAATTPTEIALAGLYAELLGTKNVGINDDFFALGGHSLLATRLVTRIRDQLATGIELKQLFQSPTIAGLAKVIDSGDSTASFTPIARVSRDADLPLSFAQQRLWFLYKLMPDSSLYNVPWAMRLRGTLNPIALQAALNTLLARHETLHTRFTEIAGEPMQYLANDAALNLDIIDVRRAPATTVEETLTSLSQQVFKLSEAPLLRVHLLQESDDSQVLLFVIHHIIADAWSLGLLFDELMICYGAECEGQTAALLPLPIQYTDFAAWQQEQLDGAKLQQHIDFWKQALGGAPALLELPTDRPRPGIQSYRGAITHRVLPAALIGDINRLGSQQGATLFQTLFAAFNIMLSRYAHQDDIVVGTPVAGRPRRELEGLIGFFLNTLPIRTQLTASTDFRSLLSQLKQQTLEAYTHQDLPFEQLVEQLQPNRDMSHAPVFQVMFTLQTVAAEKPLHGGVTAEAVDINYGTAKYDITWSVLEQDGKVKVSCEYASDLFDASTIGRMLEHYQVLLQDIARRPAAPVQQLGMLTAGEHAQLRAWNSTQTSYQQSGRLHTLFEQHASNSPDATAVEFAGTRLSYRELNERANGIAAQLIALGAGPDKRIAICVNRSLDTLVGLLGILKSGSAYVPLDPIYPPERIAYMLEDSGSRILVSEPALAAALPIDNVQVVDVGTATPLATNPDVGIGPQNLAYLIYTSGSTGLPKGVQIEHQAAVNFLTSMASEPGISAADRLLAVTTLCFDISILELFLPLHNGATVVIASQEQAADGFALKQLLENSGITLMQATPATWRMLHDAHWQGDKSLTVLAGGEALERELAVKLHAGNKAVWNMYGPTETTIWSACHRFAPEDSCISVGQPIANTQFYVLDDGHQLLPVGIPGALWIGGHGVARGYWQRDELNATSFIENPFGDGRIYCTGDRVRWLPNGSVEVLGRTDYQVKLRGFRIELGEIEARLNEHPDVTQAIVILREDNPGDPRLVAYSITPEGVTVAGEQLRQLLKGSLPDYMVPSAYVHLERFPLTPNGKIDRKALPAPEWEDLATAEYVAPRTPVEETLATLWAAVLGVPQVGIHDDFFALGGHSLLAMALLSRIQTELGASASLLEFFTTPNIEAQATFIENAGEQAEFTPIPVVNREQKLPLTSAQKRLWFLDQFEPGTPVYNMPWSMQMDGPFNPEAMQYAVDQVVARHESFRTSFPEGSGEPYQQIAPQVAAPLQFFDMPNASDAEVAAKLTELGRQSMSLQQAPLAYFSVIRLSDSRHVMSLVIHHIIFDAWSHGILLGELAEFYTASCKHTAVEPPPLRIQYADYAVWQNEWLASEDYDQQLGYWKKQLQNAPALLELPTDRPRPPVLTNNGANAFRPLPAELQQNLKHLSQQQGCTLFMVLLTAFNVLLSKYSNQTDIVVGSSIAGRRQTELEKIIGFFLHNLAIRTDLSENPRFTELLQQVTQTALEAFAHQEIPFENLVEELAPQRDPSYPPIVQVHFVLQHFDNDWGTFDQLSTTPLAYEFGTAKFDIILFMFDTPDGLSIRIEYNTDLFDAATMDSMAERFETLLSNVAAQPAKTINELSLVNDAEQRELIECALLQKSDYSQTLCIHQQFEQWAAQTPDKLALRFEDQQLTYAELNTAANKVAHQLIAAGVKTDELVGLSVERSLDTVVGVLGILKAGAGYLPLDPHYPKDRLAYMLDDSRAKVVLTQRETAETLQPTDVQLLHFEDLSADLPGHNPNVAMAPHNLAYVIYTSGSTGKPKGVLIEHQNVTRLMAATEDWYHFNASDVWSLFHSYAFDFTVWELWGALTYGGTLVVVPYWVSRSTEDFYKLLLDEKVTVLNQTPSAFAELMRVDGLRKGTLDLRYVIFGGEALDIPSLQPWFERHGDTKPQLVNMYGITETTVHVTYRPVALADCANRSSNIGVPIPDLQVYVLDADLQPLPTGIAGEMYVGGAGLARGYLHRADLTAERFITHPFSQRAGEKLYKTGDVARYLNNGDLEYLGRADHQVKLRGFRIELGEIETELNRHPAVEQSVVMLREDVEGDKRLTAYVVADAGKLDQQQVATWQQEQVNQWQGIFQETYGQRADDIDPTFNITGWNSSYTETPIEPAEMRVWVETTVERIKALQPKRVLEVGSGTGLLMSRLAADCERYVCTDFSGEAYAAGCILRDTIPGLSHVEMFQRGGDELDDFADSSFDVVVINSVAQYFPNLEYLVSVIDGATRVIADDGYLFLGDLRSVEMLRAHHTSVQLFQAEDKLSIRDLQQRIDQDVAQDEELLCDPGLFPALMRSNARISRIRYDLKRGDFRNELTRFRYDVTLRIGASEAAAPEPEIIGWSLDYRTDTIAGRIQQCPANGVWFKNVPDARLAPEALALDRLAMNDETLVTAGDLAKRIKDAAGIEPETLFTLAIANAVDIQTVASKPGFMHVLIRRAGNRPATDGTRLVEARRSAIGSYANNPLHGRLQRSLAPLLKQHLKASLPDYMVPSAFVTLSSLPLTPSGKVARNALPPPDRIRLTAGEYMAPTNATEIAIAAIWEAVLGLEKVSINDDFFALGGHSLLATQVISRVRDAMAVKLPLVALFNHPTIASLAATIADAAVVLDADVIKPADRQGVLPLSFSQQRLWFIHQMMPENTAYNSPWPMRLEGKLDTGALQQALDIIVARHEVLRTTYQSNKGKPCQVIEADARITLQLEELPGADDAELAERVSTIAHQTFDLKNGPMLYAHVLRYREDAQLFVMVFHHISMDAWSSGVLINEVSEAYNALLNKRAPVLPELTVQYADYAAWQREWIHGAEQTQQLDYWKQRLAGAPDQLGIPTDKPRPAVQTYAGAYSTRMLAPQLLGKLQELAQENDSTLFMTLLAAFNVLLSVQARQDDIVIGTPIAGRRHAGLQNLIGVFINMLPMRIDLSAKPKFTELLKQVRSVALDAYSNEDLPFEMLVEELQPTRDMSHSPIFQVIFDIQIPPKNRELFEGLYQSAFDSDLADVKVDLTLTGLVLEEGLRLRLDYNTDLFETATIERMLASFEALLDNVVDAPSLPINQYNLLSPQEQTQLVSAAHDARYNYARSECLHELFERQVAQHPERIALTCEGISLSYAELNARANRLAHCLIGKGVTADTLIGLSMERSSDVVIGILGILKSGGAYLPLDPHYPEDRLAFMVEDSRTPFIVTHREAVERAPASDAELIVLEDLSAELPVSNPDIALDEHQLAYVIYTSGSTGKPKGVLIEHQNVTRLMQANEDWYGFNENDVWTLFHSYAFDFTVWELWGSLLYGGRLVVVPYFVSRSAEAFYKLLVNENVTVLNQTPSAFSALMRVDQVANAALNLRYVIFGGEALDLPALKPWFDRHGDSHPQLINMYGITETTVHVTYRPLVKADCSSPSSNIGVPIRDLQVYVLNEARVPVPAGAPGEMYVGGAGLARGYLNRPDLTVERFVPHPFDKTPGARLYRTGDLARYRSDGDLEYMGRVDDQVKLRGFRIELGEIESALLSHASVDESMVLLHGQTADDRKLVAYVVHAPTRRIDVRELRQHLKTSLPEYMIPAAIIALDELPLTANGKVDRKALPEPEWIRAEDEPLIAARNPLEELLLGLWRDVIGKDAIGIHDDFFELGGHSLLATQLVARVGDALEKDVNIRLLFEHGSVAEFAAALDGTAEATAEQAIAATSRQSPLPLSFAQQRLWFLDQLDPENAVYNIPWAIGLSGPLQLDALQTALNALLARHEVLRTTFPSDDGNPLQLIAAPGAVTIEQLNLEAASDTELQHTLAKLAQQPFSLSAGPLFRVKLIRRTNTEHILLLCMHHIISDGWSLNVMFRELVQSYEAACSGEQCTLPPLAIQYADYAAWQRQWLSGTELDRQLDYWRYTLNDAPAKLELPIDKPRPGVQTFNGDYVSRTLSAELHQALQQVARANGCTLYMVLLATFNVLLYRYSGQDDFTVGTPIAGRRRTELNDLLGFFINTLVLRSDLSGQPSFTELLTRVRKTALDAYSHQELPFEKLVDELQPVRDMSHTPLFQVMFILQNAPWDSVSFSDLEARPVDLDFGTAKFDLTLSMAERADGLEAYFEFNTDLYEKATIERMLDHFEVIARSVTANPEQNIATLDMLTATEQQTLLYDWNDTAEAFAASSNLPALIAKQVALAPEQTAIWFADERLSYAEMNAGANRLAHYLIERGIGKGDIVALSLERSAHIVIGILAIMKTGAAYVPVDPTYPEDRRAYMLEDSAAALILTQQHLLANMPPHQAQVVCIDAEAEQIAACVSDNPTVHINTHDLAYIIYTSGSTGRPKGVMVEHHGICNLIDAQRRAFGLTPADRMLQFASISFDASIYEIVKGLGVGATLCIAGSDDVLPGAPLLKLLQDKAISAVTLPPSALYQLPTADLPALKTITVAGEACPPELVARWQPGRRFFNLYGPTEFTVWATYKECFAGETVNIGSPISNARAYVLDANLQPLPIGVAGELCIAGESLARGYWQRDELTAEKFVANPWSSKPGARMYRTGDRAQWNSDGEIEFLGRIDYQVKVRGFRIELGEIETALNEHPAVSECLVMARGSSLEDNKLVGYIIANGNAPELGELRSHLQQTLPDFMVPSGFVVLDAWPLTPNGKIDRKALPDAGSGKLTVNTEYVAPANRNEEILAAIWGELLGTEHIGVHDNFFELGGDSILSIQIIARANQRGLRLKPKQLFQNQTIRELAAVIASDTPKIDAEQRRVLGDIVLTPIQQWFLQQKQHAAEHFNQSMLLETNAELEPVILEQALHLITDQHDALRLRYTQHSDQWHQTLAPFEDSQLLVDMRKAADADPDKVQASLNLQTGPLLKAALLSNDRLLIVIHHLAVDWVSWPVILADLEFAYQRLLKVKPVAFPRKTTSFKAWAERLERWAASDALQQELGYWQNRPWEQVLQLTADTPDGSNAEAHNTLYTVDLDAKQTAQLRQGIGGRQRIGPREFLLTAVAEALAEKANATNAVVMLDLEGHGREDLFDDVDLSRTVGWFTTLFPLVLELPANDRLRAVGAQLAALPNNGIGYGVLRYLHGDELLRDVPQADVSFNYLGNIDKVAGSNSMFRPINEARGAEHSSANERLHSLDINGIISDGRLYLNFGFSSERFTTGSIAALAENVRKKLLALLKNSDSAVAGNPTPAGFPLATISQAELDTLLSDHPVVDDLYPLTALQQGMLFHSLIDQNLDVYKASFNWLLEGDIDAGLLEQAWNLVINEHSSLRSSVHWQGLREPLQIVARNVQLPFTAEDWRELGGTEQDAKLATWSHNEQHSRFDLGAAPLTRVTLIRLGERSYRMIWSFHHMIMDGWSVPLVIREVFAAYEALHQGAIPELTHTRPFSDYIGWLQVQDQAAAKTFWTDYLQGFRAPTPLPAAKAADNAQRAAPDYAEQLFSLPAASAEALKRFAKRHRLTMNTITQGAWALLLSRYSGEEDVMFGATTAGRPAELDGIESMIGLFLNTLPTRIGIDESAAVTDWLQQIQTQQLDIQQYEYSALVDIQGWSDVPRGANLFETLLAFENYPDIETMGQTAGSIAIKDSRGFDRTNFPLTLNVAMMDTLYLRFIYDRNLFSEARLQRLATHLLTQLSGIAEASDKRVADIPMLSDAERQLMASWNSTARPYPPEATLLTLLDAQAGRTPDAVAVSFAGERMSYRELEHRSNQLARYLQQHNVATGAMVGICLERSAALVVAILAVVKAGAAYVPMDPEYPEQRLQHMAEDAGLKLIISQNNVATIVQALPVTAVNLDTVSNEIARLPTTAPDVQVQPDDLAYVIFTSGSTGRPKGVMNEHRGIVNRLLWMQDEYQLNQDDRVLQKTPFSFDVSVWEFFWPLITGAELVVAKPGRHRDAAYLAETIKVEQITTLHFVPSMLQIFLQNASSAGCTSLQRVICSGEALPFDVQRRFFERFEHAGLHNLYGPTEAAIEVTYWPCERHSVERSVPIGRPVANTRLYIVDAHGQQTALGVPGELWIAGVQVARGYAGRDELTAERFIADPFIVNPDAVDPGRDGSRVYRTGDLVRFRDDGAVEFLGRIDHQVKLRGFRIELGEIEAVLDTCHDVDQSVVLLREDTPGLAQLVAYVARADLQFDKAAAREVLAAALPDYMLPGAYVVLADLPVTANGKIDRRALPAPEAPQSSEEYIAPRNPLETEVAQIWAELLGVDQVGLRDDFFALGGHSLIAMQLVSRIAASKGVQLPIDSVFITPTLEALCAAILQSDKSKDDNISSISRSSRRNPTN